MKILSFGAGMQSTALALMSCENAKAKGDVPYPLVPVYDAVIYCDLGWSRHGYIISWSSLRRSVRIPVSF